MDLSGRPRHDPVPGYALRLRPIVPLCAGLVGLALLLALASWLLDRLPVGALPNWPRPVPLLLSLLAAMLILLSSRIRSSILRRALPRSAGLTANTEAVLAAYRRATVISFAILVAAALLGLLVALTSARPVYGIVLCLASSVGMLSRWPRAVEIDRLVRGRAVL